VPAVLAAGHPAEHRRAGRRTLIEVNFRATVDGRGRHGEAIDVLTNDPPCRATAHPA
jgi:hypothetical protein